jgi:hypothetical protein
MEATLDPHLAFCSGVWMEATLDPHLAFCSGVWMEATLDGGYRLDAQPSGG